VQFLQDDSFIEILQSYGPLNPDIQETPVALTLHFIETLHDYVVDKSQDYSSLYKAIIDLFFRKKSKGISTRITDHILQPLKAGELTEEWTPAVLEYYETKLKEHREASNTPKSQKSGLLRTKPVSQVKKVKKSKKAKGIKAKYSKPIR